MENTDPQFVYIVREDFGGQKLCKVKIRKTTAKQIYCERCRGSAWRSLIALPLCHGYFYSADDAKAYAVRCAREAFEAAKARLDYALAGIPDEKTER